MPNPPSAPTQAMIEGGVEELLPYYAGANVDQVVRAIWDAMHKSMKLEDFNSGDVVTLKSGGARMTVRYTVDYPAALNTGLDLGVHCDWQDSSGQPHSFAFRPEQLAIMETA